MELRKLLGNWTIENTGHSDAIPRWFDAFLIDRKSQDMSPGTLEFYRYKLMLIDKGLAAQNIRLMQGITPDAIRRLLVDLDASGHNHGGIHQVYRVLRAFLNWYAREEELQDWQSPLRNIKPPRLSVTPLKPIDMRDLSKMLAVCPDDLCGLRDVAIMLFLLDSGVRAAELLALNLEDCDPVQGDVQVKSGKGRKTRSVAIGRKARKSLRQYLKLRVDDCDALWVTDDGHRLSYKGLLQMLGRRGLKAGVARPTPHDFRRAFALNCLRNGMDVYSLQRLMGHADLQVLRRYLAQTDDDLREAHAKASPVDNWL